MDCLCLKKKKEKLLQEKKTDDKNAEKKSQTEIGSIVISHHTSKNGSYLDRKTIMVQLYDFERLETHSTILKKILTTHFSSRRLEFLGAFQYQLSSLVDRTYLLMTGLYLCRLPFSSDDYYCFPMNNMLKESQRFSINHLAG